MDDQEIIRLFFARDEKAIQETEAKYGKLCLHIAGNILPQDADAEECVNDTYLSLWNTIPPQSPRNFPAYICRITRNISLKKLRYSKAQKRCAGLEVSLTELEAILPDARWQRDLEDAQVGRLISDFLRKEKEAPRNVFIRRYWFMDSIAAIAECYGFSESKVKSMLFHTRNRLKTYLEKEGVYL